MTRRATRRRRVAARGTDPRPTRTRALLLRLTDEELERLRARARAVGRPAARYAREAALGASFTVPESRVDSSVLVVLRRLALDVAGLRDAPPAGDPALAARAEAALDALLAAADRV